MDNLLQIIVAITALVTAVGVALNGLATFRAHLKADLLELGRKEHAQAIVALAQATAEDLVRVANGEAAKLVSVAAVAIVNKMNGHAPPLVPPAPPVPPAGKDVSP